VSVAHGSATPNARRRTSGGSGAGRPLSPLPEMVVYTVGPTTRRCTKNAASASASKSTPSAAALP